jgi:hypothetical protein
VASVRAIAWIQLNPCQSHYRLVRWRKRAGEHVLCAAHVPSRAKTATVAALAEVVGGRRPENSHRTGAGRRGVRQRAQSYLHPPTPRSAERDSRQTWKENVARTRSPRRDAARFPATALPPPLPDGELVLFGETEALGTGPGPLPAHADASSPAARIKFQSVSVETSPPFPEDVNRAKLLHNNFHSMESMN